MYISESQDKKKGKKEVELVKRQKEVWNSKRCKQTEPKAVSNDIQQPCRYI